MVQRAPCHLNLQEKKNSLAAECQDTSAICFTWLLYIILSLENRLLKNPFTAACLNYSLTAFHKEPINQLGLARRKGLPWSLAKSSLNRSLCLFPKSCSCPLTTVHRNRSFCWPRGIFKAVGLFKAAGLPRVRLDSVYKSKGKGRGQPGKAGGRWGGASPRSPSFTQAGASLHVQPPGVGWAGIAEPISYSPQGWFAEPFVTRGILP